MFSHNKEQTSGLWKTFWKFSRLEFLSELLKRKIGNHYIKKNQLEISKDWLDKEPTCT